MKSPKEIVDLMLAKDAFSHWMRLEVVSLQEGSCELACTVTPTMLNGFEIAHGGISYAISDSALAFASNSRGHKCVSIETSISHLLPVYSGDRLVATCTEIHRGRTFGIYTVAIRNQNNALISTFKGTVNISSDIW